MRYKKGLGLALAFATLASFPITSVSAESFTYTATVSQPELAVQVISTIPEKDQELKLDRENPIIYFDTVEVQNTGEVDTNMYASATAEGLEGSDVTLTTAVPGNPSLIQIIPTNPETTTLFGKNAIGSGNLFLFATQAGQSREIGIAGRVHKDFNSSVSVTITINSVAI